VVGHVLAADAAAPSMLLRRVAKVSRADQVLHLTDRPNVRGGYLPVPRAGPILTWRAVTDGDMPPLAAWNLTMGDIELF
jgi:hypothetical protein